MNNDNFEQNKDYFNAYANIDSSTMFEVNSQLATENSQLRLLNSNLYNYH